MKPSNVEDEGQMVQVKAWMTHYWQDGRRWPILYMLDADERPNYDRGMPVVTNPNQHPDDPRIVR